MALIGMQDVCWGFVDPPLLENITFQIEKGERVCLVGRNGVGKSTLLKLLGGDEPPKLVVTSMTRPLSRQPRSSLIFGASPPLRLERIHVRFQAPGSG